MNKIRISACGKINISLNIEGKREDGYHLLSSLFQSVDIKNILEAEKADEFSFFCDDKNLPADERNTAVKASFKFFSKTGIVPDTKMTLKKVIPYGAGMGSASSDAAAALLALNKLHGDILSEEEILEIALSVGADVPFAYKGGTAFVEGIGEKMTSVKPLPPCAFLVVKPSYSVSTKEAYQKVDSSVGVRSDNKELLKALEDGNLEGIAKNANNAFYYVLNFSQNEKIKNAMLNEGALASTLTGSGSAMFGIFKNVADAKKAQAKIEGSFICLPTEKSLFIEETE